MIPRLLYSELSGNVYVVTRYTAKPSPRDPMREILLAHRKYDVTEDFHAAVRTMRKFDRAAAAARRRKKKT